MKRHPISETRCFHGAISSAAQPALAARDSSRRLTLLARAVDAQSAGASSGDGGAHLVAVNDEQLVADINCFEHVSVGLLLGEYLAAIARPGS